MKSRLDKVLAARSKTLGSRETSMLVGHAVVVAQKEGRKGL